MKQNLEKRFSLWTVWSYEGEETWINKMSEQGLHLDQAYLGWSTFRRDPAVRYTYRLDYRPDLRGPKRTEYFNLYADAGWEHACTYGGTWHYFRRPWQPGEEQVLYTDRSSLIEHYRRIRRVVGVAALANVVIAMSNLHLYRLRPMPSGVAYILVFQALVVLLLLRGLLAMGRKIKTAIDNG